MWGVVRSNHVDGAILDALDKCSSILCRAQRWVHLPACILLEVHVGEDEVVGTRLASDLNATRLGLAHQLHGLLCRYVAHMVAAAQALRNLYVALNLLPLALRADALVAMCLGILAIVDVATLEQLLNLAVCRDKLVVLHRLGHGALHHAVNLHAAAVVRECAHLTHQRGHIHEFLALAADGDCGIGQHLNLCVAVYYVLLRLEVLHAVGNGVEVGH